MSILGSVKGCRRRDLIGNNDIRNKCLCISGDHVMNWKASKAGDDVASKSDGETGTGKEYVDVKVNGLKIKKVHFSEKEKFGKCKQLFNNGEHKCNR